MTTVALNNLWSYIQGMSLKKKDREWLAGKLLEPVDDAKTAQQKAFVKESLTRALKEVEEAKKAQKRKDIEDLFGTIGFQTFVTLEHIWDEKWLNATVPMSKIEEQMKSRMYQIGDDVATIHSLPEFSFEAMEIYKKTLDLSKAVQEGQRLADIQKRKAAYEEEQRRKQEEAEAARKAQDAEALPEPEETPVLAVPEEPENVSANQPSVEPEQPLIQLDFRVWGTKDQLMALRQYMVENNLRFGKVE